MLIGLILGQQKKMEDSGLLILENLIKLTRSSENKFKRGNFKGALDDKIKALLIARSGGIGVKDFVFAAMTGSFLTAPLFAWMAMDTINSKLVPTKNRYGFFLKTISWIGLIFLTIFSLLFIANSFFGIG